MRLLTLVTVMLFFTPNDSFGSEASSNERDIAEDVEKYVRRWQSENPYAGYAKHVYQHDAEDVIREARKYAQDPERHVRSEAIIVEFRSALASDHEPVIRATVEYLAGIIEKRAEPNDVSVAAKFLRKLDAMKFTEKAKRLIAAGINRDKPTSGLILLAGVAQMQSQKQWLMAIAEPKKPEEPEESVDQRKIRRLFENERSRQKLSGNQLSATLALARMGHQPAIDKIIENYHKEDDLTRRLLHDAKQLQYIRSPKAVDELVAALKTDWVYPPSIDTDPIPHAALAITYLQQMVEGFPVRKNDYSRISKAETQEARDWVSQQESLKIIK